MRHEVYNRLEKIAVDIANIGYTSAKALEKVAPKVHKIEYGENPTTIARKYGVGVKDLLKSNKVDPRRLRPGQYLVVPPPQPPPPKYLGPTEKTMRIIRQLESSGGKRLKGDWRDASGKYHASGEYQIREVYPGGLADYRKKRTGKSASYSAAIDEVNDLFGTDYVLDDRDDPVKARDIASKYMYILGNRYAKIYNRLPTESEVARMYNGGFDGMNSERAIRYGREFDKISGGPRLVKPQPWHTPGYIKAFDELRLLDPYYKSKSKALAEFDSRKRAEYEAKLTNSLK